jgi:Phage integrase family/Putative transposase
VLSREEGSRLINAAGTLFRRTLLMTLYGTGMRRSELAHLKVGDVDSQRMIIRVVAGKRGKDRDLPLSPALLETLREYWRWRKPKVYLFPACTRRVQSEESISDKTVWIACSDTKHLGAEIGVIAILHTWGQNLLLHPHIQCVIPAGGLSPDHRQWVRPHYPFFLPVRDLLLRNYQHACTSILPDAFITHDPRMCSSTPIHPCAHPKSTTSLTTLHQPSASFLHHRERSRSAFPVSTHRPVAPQTAVQIPWCTASAANASGFLLVSLSKTPRNDFLFQPEGSCRGVSDQG